MSLKKLPITVLPAKFQHLFPFPEFNHIQSAVFNLIYRTNKSVVVATPTGSGKTVLAELGFVQMIAGDRHKKILYLTPLKALSYEKEQDFGKFGAIGVQLEVLTGDVAVQGTSSSYSLLNSRLYVATIEKFDSLTRRKRYASLISNLGLVVIDEIHMLGDESRGAVLEGLVTRIKLLNPHCRIIGLSATIPNVEEVSTWLRAEPIVYGDEYRPSKLVTKVISYKSSGNDFKDKYRRIYKAWTVARKFLPEQTLIFVSSRGDTVLTAKKIVEHQAKQGLAMTGPRIRTTNRNLGEVIRSGVAFHHAGLSLEDRRTVEDLFKAKQVQVLVATSTLAWGVNLPAKVVVIQDVTVRSLEGTELLTAADLWQMLGRAGRPQYDTEGFGYVVTAAGEERTQVENSLLLKHKVLSQLEGRLVEVLLAELFRESMAWHEVEAFISQSFWWVQSSPTDREDILSKVEDTLHLLERWHFILLFDDIYRVTPIGAFTAQYYINPATASDLVNYAKGRIQLGLPLLRDIVNRIQQFQQIPIRRDERNAVENIRAEFMSTTEELTSDVKVIAVLYKRLQGQKTPIELSGDAYVITQMFLRHWAFFKEVTRYFHGEELFPRRETLWDELF